MWYLDIKLMIDIGRCGMSANDTTLRQRIVSYRLEYRFFSLEHSKDTGHNNHVILKIKP